MATLTGGLILSAARPLDPNRLPDYQDRLLRTARSLCGSRHDAEDLVQETYARVLRHERLIRHSDPAAYLLRALRNTWVNRYRSDARTVPLTSYDCAIDDVVEEAADPASSVVEREALLAAISRLTPILRETLFTVDVLGFSYKEAARLLGTRVGTIMSRVHRARQAVRLSLADPSPGDVGWAANTDADTRSNELATVRSASHQRRG